MPSRLDRLLLLLDTGSTPVVRSAAAKQLGDIQQSHPQELQNLLQKVYIYLRSKNWESRIAAGEAISSIIKHVPLWGNCKAEDKDSEYLCCDSFSLEQVITHGTPLLGSIGTEYDTFSTDQISQKDRLSKELGLTVGKVNLSEDLFNDEDLVQVPQIKVEDCKKSVSSLLNGDQRLSAREMNRAKRKAKQLSRQNSLSTSREGIKRQRTMETAAEEPLLEWVAPEPEEWCLMTIVQYLVEDLLSSEWELRHGATIGLRAILRKHRYTLPWLIDVSLRLVTVLALDRFGDYVSHEVVAPVRETAAQSVGIITSHLPLQHLLPLQKLFLELLECEEWQARHGGLLAIKYLLAARQDISPGFLAALLPYIVRSISDEDDDVRAVAAASLLPVADSLPNKVSEELVLGLADKLWTSLTVLDDLSASTSSIITLLAALVNHRHICDHYNKEREGLDILVPRLRPYMIHVIRSVRKDSLLAVHLMLKTPGSWVDMISPLFARVLYQRLFLESEDSFHALILKVWESLFKSTSPETCKKIVTDHLPLWFHFLGAPPGLTLDSNLFFKPPPGVPLSVPLGAREFTIKTSLVKALGSVAKLSDVAMFIPHVVGLLNSGCASHKQGACLVTLQLIEECGLTKDSFPSLTSQLSALITSPLTFDELLAANQNLQIRCRGLLSTLVNKPFIKEFVALSVFNFESANSLVHTCRQNGVASTECNIVEGVSQNLATTTTVLSTRVYSLLAGVLIQLEQLTPKLNPLIKPIMDSIKRETSEELQVVSAKNLIKLTTLVVDRTPCPNSKIIKNIFLGLLEDKVKFPNVETTLNPLLFIPIPSPGVSTPTTPVTPSAASFHSDVMSNLGTLTKYDGMISYVSQVCAVGGTKSGRGRGKKECNVEADSLAPSSSQITHKGCRSTLCHLAEHHSDKLIESVQILKTDVFDLLSEERNIDEKEENTETVNKLITALYVLHTIYPSLSQSPQTTVLNLLPALTSLLTHHYTAVRHAAVRVVTTLTRHNTVEVMNHVLSNSLKELDSTHSNRRQGTMECIYHIVKKLELKLVPYVVLLVVPTLQRMGDTSHDVRALATLTFAQLVRLMPLDGARSEVEGILPELKEEKIKQRVFLEQLMDPSTIKNCEVPIKIDAKLRKYQQDGVNWLWFLCQFGLHGILCDDMGLGKTLQTLCIVGTSHYKRRETRPDENELPSLVVCPPTLIGHWFYETEKFVKAGDLSALMYHGTAVERLVLQRDVRSQAYNLIICSYDVLRNDSDFFSSLKWNYCVLDEGHVIKNTKTKVAIAIRGIKAAHRLILSGTPIQNNVLELWGLFEWLMPGFLGTERQFNELYSKPINLSRDPKSSPKDQEAGALAMEALHRQVLPFLLRRMKEDVLNDLPPKIIQDYYCTLTPLQKQLYEQFSETIKSTDLKSETEVHVFQSLQYLRKICNHPILILPKSHELYPKMESSESLSFSGKLMALNQLLSDCGIGSQVVSPHRVLIFCQLKSMLDIIEKFLLKQHHPNVSYLRVDGSIPPAERVPLVNKFNTDPSYDLLLLTTSVGGLGLNLTGADTVIFVEHDWNPSKDLQAMDRAHRIGQKRVVNVYRLITKDTLEERIMGLQKFKMNITNTVISTENSSLKQMGNSGLLDLFNGNRDNGKSDNKPVSLSANKKGLSAVLKDMGDLWQDEEYEREYDIKSFQESLRADQ